jgi:hypothetical protein
MKVDSARGFRGRSGRKRRMGLGGWPRVGGRAGGVSGGIEAMNGDRSGFGSNLEGERMRRTF